MKTADVKIGGVSIGGGKPLSFIAGPCVIESEESTVNAAVRLAAISRDIDIPIIFKSSYDKANRSSINSYRGPGIDSGLSILDSARKESGLPVISDVHSIQEAWKASEVLDGLQIPAFLCRQTDLIFEASMTGKPVNVKKGQFLAPGDVKNIIHKFTSTGNKNITLTERGVSFGHHNLVVDMRSIPIMQSFGYPVVFDATHSVQLPGGLGGSSGGEREFVAPLARAAVAAGCDAVFLEVHECPDKALCDGPNMIALDSLAELLTELNKINELVNKR